ncbi:hypothetical protein F5X68DRAFT_260251 [Plectosphaerella plurivora]|uniref:RFTS domain-containing protein n=1 Tax=Plectosphaerella plurivora TaxID=936078 RepID=A0A9P8VFN5_9PEZI|nr:hypothetical protein F5X68DRAFT_260251 [Plectosphaerella plurivora]
MGRPRKLSNSTVATVEAELIPYTNETSVLDPPKEGDNYDDFIYVLEHVAVYDKHGGMANLLSVAFDGPFTVRGMIRVEKANKSQFLKTTPKTQYISITGCTHYSVGVGDNRSPCIWAGGKCGWYEIRPPMPAYSPIYEKMNQAVSLYFLMQDVHSEYEDEERERRARLKPRGRKATKREIFANFDEDTMFLKYAVLVGDGCFRDEVIAACDEHAPFLISQFFYDERPGNQDKFGWPSTAFYRWLTARHPDIVEKVRNPALAKKKSDAAPAAPVLAYDPPSRKALAPRQAPANATVESPAPVDTELPDAADVEEKDFAPVRRRTRRSQSSEQHQPRPSPKRASTQASSPPNVSEVDHPMEEIPEVLETTETTLVEDPPAVTEDTIMEDESSQTIPQLLRQAVEYLMETYSKDISKVTYSWVKSHLYYKHRMKEYNTSNTILELYAAELLPLLDPAVWGVSQFYTTLGQLAVLPRPDPGELTEAVIRHNLQRRTAAANQGQPRGPRKTIETPDRTVSRAQGGKTSGLRPSYKRNISDLEAQANPRGSKAGKHSHSIDEVMEAEQSDVVEDSSDDDDDSAETPVPVKVVLEAERLPDFTPKGPNGAWVCDQADECVFVERNPQDADGQARIQDHIREEHEEQGQAERINLALMEGGRGHLPIDHLLEKIRKLGAKVEEREGVLVNDNLMKKPVKRRLLI